MTALLALLAALLRSFQPEIAISGENGGGGNRTRVTSHPDTSVLQGVRESLDADDPRPSLCNKLPRSAGARALAQNGRLAKLASGTASVRDSGRGRSRGSVLLNAASSSREALSADIGESYPPHRNHRGGLRLHGVARPYCTLRNWFAARLCACVDDRDVALGSRVACARLDRPAGVRLGSVRVLPFASRLLVHRFVVVRDPAGESMPSVVGCRPRCDVGDPLGAGALADLVREAKVWLAVWGAQVPTRSRLVLSLALSGLAYGGVFSWGRRPVRELLATHGEVLRRGPDSSSPLGVVAA